MSQLMVTMVMFIQENGVECWGKNCYVCIAYVRTKYSFISDWDKHTITLLISIFIEHHASKPELPSEVSKTSKGMAWYQPPKKVISSEYASSMKPVSQAILIYKP